MSSYEPQDQTHANFRLDPRVPTTHPSEFANSRVSVTGCTEVPEGCDHCYAKTFTERFRGVPGHRSSRASTSGCGRSGWVCR